MAGTEGDQKGARRSTAANRKISTLLKAFESAGLRQPDGVEYWLARDMAKILDYSDFRNFTSVVEKAKNSCRNSGIEVGHHFVEVTEMVHLGSGAKREIDDIKLSRYACYLVAQNADGRKPPVAFAQTYFAVQTRRQEEQDDPAEEDNNREGQKRIFLREEMKAHNKHLASAAKSAGVIKPLDYAVFQNEGYKGLYGGLDRAGIQNSKGLKKTADILDHMGSTELAANLFRATQTEEKLRRDNIRGKAAANLAHREVGAKVRQTIKDIGGTMPEHLPVEENIKRLEKRIKRLPQPDGDEG